MGTVGRGRLMVVGLVLAAACMPRYRSKGGGEIDRQPAPGQRRLVANDVAVPAGFTIEVVAQGLTFPTGVAFDDRGDVYVTESGYAYGEVFTTPRLLRIARGGGQPAVVAEGEKNGPWNGLTHVDGDFFVSEGGVMEGGRILRIAGESGKISTIASGMPSQGDHHTNGPVARDGWIYFGQGTATNSAVVGEDNHQFGWLGRFPQVHDVPCQDVTLTGQNFVTENPLTPSPDDRATTGPFLPFGTAGKAGQVVPGKVPCSGAVMRVRPTGGEIELVAWGFRNPFGLAFAPDGRLFVTDNGFDERGSRPVFGGADMLWEVRPGQWYGWPDFSEGRPLGNPHYGEGEGEAPRAVLSEHPGEPPKPAAYLAVHASADGLDFSRSARFGHVGNAFIAEFGDQAPAVGMVTQPVGFKVVRVDLAGGGVITDFAVNRGKKNGPASRLGTGGLERPLAVRFDPTGDALYVVDFGVLTMSKAGSRPVTGTGALWRITRSAGGGK